jgi:MFS family permease
MKNTVDVIGGKPIAVLLQSISGIRAINPLVAFYDIHGGKREVLFLFTAYNYCFQLDWVCEKDNLPATAQAIFFCGAIFGGLIFGWIADKYGRIPALMGE